MVVNRWLEGGGNGGGVRMLFVDLFVKQGTITLSQLTVRTLIADGVIYIRILFGLIAIHDLLIYYRLHLDFWTMYNVIYLD